MPEPRAQADTLEQVTADVWEWTVHDERINFATTAHAVATAIGTVLIDPVPLAPGPLAELGTIEAIVLCSGSHQRSAWRYRRKLGAPVWLPELVRRNEEEPDRRYAEGDELPGGLKAYFVPGAGTTQHALLLPRDGGVLFVPDLFLLPPGGPLVLTPARYVHDPIELRGSAERLLELEFEVLCTGHGGSVSEDPKEAIRAALERPVG